MGEEVYFLIEDGPAFTKALKETLDSIEKLLRMIEEKTAFIRPQ